MANLAQAQVMVSPNYMEPGILLPYTQQSGAFETLADRQPRPQLDDGTLAVYMKRLDVRTKIAAGNTAYNELPSVTTMLRLISTATYLMRVRAEYDHHDTAAFGQYGVSIAETQRLGMRQAHFQLARAALLYGFNPGYGEGLINTAGATAVSLPPDTNGNQTVGTYDNGQLGIFLLGLLQALKTRTNQMGQATRFVVLGPQRILAPMEIQNIVQVTQFQRPGAGSATTAGMIQAILSNMGDSFDWAYDDTLQGKGAGGSDAVLIVMPEVKKPVGAGQGRINTNAFAEIAPGVQANTLMYCDMAAPREIPTPLPGGAIDILSEWRISSGWGVRGEAITVLSINP